MDAQEARAAWDALLHVRVEVEEGRCADASACVLLLKELNVVLNLSIVVLFTETFGEYPEFVTDLILLDILNALVIAVVAACLGEDEGTRNAGGLVSCQKLVLR